MEAERRVTHNRPSKNSGRYEMSSSSGTESNTLIQEVKKLLVKGLTTYIRSDRRGMKFAKEKAFFGVPSSLISPGIGTRMP